MTQPISFKYKITGIQETITRLQQFEKKWRQKVLRKAGNEGSKVAMSALKAIAPKQTGTWKKSLGRKVIVKNGLFMWYGVGPRSAHYAIVTFDPKKASALVQSMERRRKNGNIETRTRGKERKVKVGDIGGSVRTLKKSKKGQNGELALFWRDKRGKVRAMPLKRKYWPVLYSHLIEKGTKQGARAQHVIQRATEKSRAGQEAAIHRVLSEAANEV